MRPEYIVAITCPTCGTHDAVALTTQTDNVIWCENGHITVTGAGLVHTIK